MSTSILYVPAAEDVHGVLADGLCGAKMPSVQLRPAVSTSKLCPACGAAVRWFSAPTDQTDSCWICSVDWRHKFAQADVETLAWQGSRPYFTSAGVPEALPLVWRGEVVPEAIDRLIARLVSHRWPPNGPAKTAPRGSFVASSLLPNRDGYWWLRSGWTDNSDIFDEDVPESIPDALTLPWALATIAARELGGRVEVVNG